MKKEGSLLLSDYAAEIAATDVLNPNDFNPVLQGLYGEVGGIMATAKKSVRERTAYPGFKKAAEEEFGDTLWYLAAICRRLQIPLEEIFAEAANHGNFKNVGAASDITEGALAYIAVPVAATASLDATLVRLGQSAAALLGSTPARADLIAFARTYLDAIHAAELAFRRWLAAISGKLACVLEPQADDLAGLDFDSEFGMRNSYPGTSKSGSISEAAARVISNGRVYSSETH
ncbi:Uncharacterised protein [Pseudomonas aeruginosa]|nr:Uncharacterised protein [Pseudomonas aeruginosa]